MKAIAIFCDGTWQNLSQANPTNVAKLAQATLVHHQGETQVTYYDDGVGVGQGVLDGASRILGGALGKGLDYKIQRAYEFLCFNYEPGDRIYIFGFSRGAYTARSLAGLMRRVGLVKRQNVHEIGRALELYHTVRDKPAAPGAPLTVAPEFTAFREAYGYPAHNFLDDKAYQPGHPESLAPADPKCTWVQYLGVWDTVGSLGIPRDLPFADQIDRQYEFHDTSLSRFVRSARQAVAVDERRKTFLPSLWDNIVAQNQNAHAQNLPYEQRPYQQQWFPGGHGAVGGGGGDGGLSRAALLWIAEGAARAGLGFDLAVLADYAAQARPEAPFAADRLDFGDVVLKLVGLVDRVGPASLDEASYATRRRWAEVAGWRPKPLATVADALGRAAPPPLSEQTLYHP